MTGRGRLAKTAAAVLAATVMLGVSPAAGSGRPAVRTDEVCFTVHNDGDPQASAVYGVRYSPGAPTTKAIVLVHGVSPAHEYWDLRPDFSVARTLAAAGYTVFSYDRLGWGRSPYLRPQGGHRLTLSAARSMLHEIVGQVRNGEYSAPAGGRCGAGGDPAFGPAIPTVVVMGASAAGAIVGGYPGRFHDVAAAVPVA